MVGSCLVKKYISVTASGPAMPLDRGRDSDDKFLLRFVATSSIINTHFVFIC